MLWSVSGSADMLLTQIEKICIAVVVLGRIHIRTVKQVRITEVELICFWQCSETLVKRSVQQLVCVHDSMAVQVFALSDISHTIS